MADCADSRFVGLLKRLKGINVPTMKFSTAREHFFTNTLTRLKISGFDEDFRRFIWPMVMEGGAGVIQEEYLAVYQLLKSAPDQTLLKALEAIDEEAGHPIEVNVWQYLFALATVPTKQARHHSLVSATLGFIRGIDGMARMVSGTMREDGLFFSTVLPEEEPNQERSPGNRLLGHAPPQLEFVELLSLLSHAPTQPREVPSVLVM
jgi:hypothetical protein